MPYIKQADRGSKVDAKNSGHLNFKLTQVVVHYLVLHGLSYETCNDIVGALTNCLHEFQRRVQDPYEDEKIEENGDVYPPSMTNA